MTETDAPLPRALSILAERSLHAAETLRARVARGDIAFAVVGLGPHPDRPDDKRSEAERAAAVVDVVTREGARCFGARGSYGGKEEPCIVVFGHPWAVEVAKEAGRLAGQETIFSHVPGTAAALVYCDGSGLGWVPLGKVTPGKSVDGDYTDIGGVTFHA